MRYKGLTLDRFQEEAVNSIEENYSVVVSAPTGSGKTLIADYIMNKHLPQGDRVIYTAPIKALSNQKYKDFREDYGEENVGLLTGDVSINPRAPLLIMTTEVYRNMVLTGDESVEHISYVVFDEIHFINDVERGYVWEESIIFSKPHIRFLCLSATIPNAREFADWIRSIKHHKVVVVKHTERPVPLHKQFYDSELGITTLDDIKNEVDATYYYKRRGRGRKHKTPPPNPVEVVKDIRREGLPCFFFVFSRAKCEKNAQDLAKSRIFDLKPEVNNIVRKRLSELPPAMRDLKTTQTLRKTLQYGIAFHHAGLLPFLKEIVEELFAENHIDVLFTTETFAVGINMPAKTVVFESLRKFDGQSFRFLNSKEYFQMAGRAGRRGIDEVGYAIAMVDRRDFWYKVLQKMTGADTIPLKSQFRLSVNTVLNLIKLHDKAEIGSILTMSFYSYQRAKDKRRKGAKISDDYDRIFRRLEKRGFIKKGKLTLKGEFASRIYVDEMLTGELFSTEFHWKLSDYQVMLLLGALAYEHKGKNEFYQMHIDKEYKGLFKELKSNSTLKRYKRFENLKLLTALLHPCYHGEPLVRIFRNTNLLEGDVIRYFRQVLDRIGQVRAATPDYMLKSKLESVEQRIHECIQDVDII